MSESRKGKHHSEETKKKISLSHMGENNYFYGKHHSQESKKKMSNGHIGLQAGKNHPFYGKHHTEESIKKMSESNMNRIPWNKGIKLSEETIKKMSGENNHLYGKHHSKETKQKMSESNKGKNRGKRHSEKSKKKMSLNHTDNSGEKHHNWNGGTSFEPYCPKFNEKLKERIRDKFNRKCSNCGKPEQDNITKTNKVRRLSVHHVDLDKGQGCNGKQWNLIPLCMSCHAKCHTKTNDKITKL